jgi:hypothetical protein
VLADPVQGIGREPDEEALEGFVPEEPAEEVVGHRGEGVVAAEALVERLLVLVGGGRRREG